MNRLTLSALSLIMMSVPAFAQEDSLHPTKPPFPTDVNSPKQNGSKYLDIYDSVRQEDIVPQDKPHRTTEQVATWVEDQVTTTMNIDPTTWDSHLQKISSFFDVYGLQEYQNYLKTSGILAYLQGNKMKLSAIADGSASLLSQGALSGSYHWLYQFPVMLTYYPLDMAAKGKNQAQNQKIMVRVQLGRVAKGIDDNNIVIERWSVVPVR